MNEIDKALKKISDGLDLDLMESEGGVTTTLPRPSGDKDCFTIKRLSKGRDIKIMIGGTEFVGIDSIPVKINIGAIDTHECDHEWVTWQGLHGVQTDCSKCKAVKK